jgi:putative ubiquitin-RnfH superfamily antitoxin RatB of RatAB toxin-antitoxin module
MVSKSTITVTVIYSPGPRKVQELELTMAEPCSVLKALQQSSLLASYPEINNPQILLGVWGRKAPLSQLLRDHDRVEVYRPLRVDPKVARRERFVKQGSRSAGLFVKKRAGAKAGY